jgi:DNA-binding transcriptional LysR family regulator
MKPPRVNFDQLITFYFIAKEKSLSGASEKLCITVPAVAKQMKSLESFFGVKLIACRKKRLNLTHIGTLLLPYAEEVYHCGLSAEGLLLASRNNLRVGISFALTRRFTGILSLFKKLYPSVGVTVRQTSSLKLLAELDEFQHDLCIIVAPSKVNTELRAIQIPDPQKLLLVAAPGSALCKKTEATWEDLNNYPMVLHSEESLLGKRILDEFHKRDISVFVAVSAEGAAVTTELARQNVGALFAMPWNVADDLTRGTLKPVPLKGGEPEFLIDIILHRMTTQTPACKAFLRLIEEDFGCALDVE